MSTTQVFFNTCYVGGTDETLQLLKKWDADKSCYSSPLDRYSEVTMITMMPDGSQRTEVKTTNPDGSISIQTTIKQAEQDEESSSEQEEIQSDGDSKV
jgi:hypothetical protein